MKIVISIAIACSFFCDQQNQYMIFRTRSENENYTDHHLFVNNEYRHTTTARSALHDTVIINDFKKLNYD